MGDKLGYKVGDKLKIFVKSLIKCVLRLSKAAYIRYAFPRPCQHGKFFQT